MAQCLVTGGAGFIGSHLTTRLAELGHAVRVFDDFSSGKRENLAHLTDRLKDRVEVVEGDMRHLEECQRVCRDVEYIFHQAAIPSVPKSVEHPQESHDANVTGTFNVLLAASQNRVRRFIYAASSSAYGDSEVSPKHEELVPAPLSPYAVQKLAGEHYCRAFFECYGLQTISLRYFNVFGERQDPASQYAAAIPAFVTRILRDEPPTVYGDGRQTRDFTYVENVVHGNVLAMQAEATHGEAVNVACGGEISVNQVIARVNELLGKKVQTCYVDRRPGDVMHSCADVRKARRLLGYQPQVSLADGLARAIEYYKSLG